MAQQWSVLVVSEQGEALRTISDSLTKRGYRVLTAAGGSKALALLQHENIHVVFTEPAMMPFSRGAPPIACARIADEPVA